MTSDGNLIACGRTSSFGEGKEDVYLVKLDMWGDTLWTRTYGSLDYDGGLSVVESDGDYLIGGYTA